MANAQSGLSSGGEAQLVLRRPLVPATSTLRAFCIHRNGCRVADLAWVDTARMRSTDGPRQLQGWCPPLITGELTVILAGEETVHVISHISALEEIKREVAGSMRSRQRT